VATLERGIHRGRYMVHAPRTLKGFQVFIDHWSTLGVQEERKF